MFDTSLTSKSEVMPASLQCPITWFFHWSMFLKLRNSHWLHFSLLSWQRTRWSKQVEENIGIKTLKPPLHPALQSRVCPRPSWGLPLLPSQGSWQDLEQLLIVRTLQMQKYQLVKMVWLHVDILLCPHFSMSDVWLPGAMYCEHSILSYPLWLPQKRGIYSPLIPNRVRNDASRHSAGQLKGCQGTVWSQDKFRRSFHCKWSSNKIHN